MPGNLTRREFIVTSSASALLLGFHVPVGSTKDKAREVTFAPNAFIQIDTAGEITLTIPQVEMGQGTYTSLAMVLAEEMEADWDAVRVEHAPADEKAYRNPLLPIQMTGNSTSMRAYWTPLRRAGAAARMCLLEAGARVWNVPASECRAHKGTIVHTPSGRALGYASLVHAAASIAPPSNVELKDPGDFRLIGRALKRLDTPDKTNGHAVYGIDVRLPRMKVATLKQSPVLGGKVSGVDDSRARTIPGVRQVLVLDDLVAVVADNMWAAEKGLGALEISWNDGPNTDVSSELIWARLRAASKRDGAVAKNVGRTTEVLSESAVASELVVSEYELPLLAHTCMEPLNCTVHVTPTSAEAWIGTQVMGRVQAAVARGANVPESNVTIHNHLLGGGFGRRLETDMAYNAARIAAHVKDPVKVVWTREEDIRHDIFRPPYHDVIAARLQGSRIVGWKHKVSSSAVLARFLPVGFKDGVDLDGIESAHDIPYEIPNYRVEFNREEPPGVITGLWRGVGANNAIFAIECFMDELARRTRVDPIAFRRAHLDPCPRLQAALDLVRRTSRWDAALGPRRGRGVAAQTSFGSYIATVVECEVDEAGEIHLRRVTTAVDAGLAVNPDIIVAQLQGGLIFGLSAALYGEITLAQGRVQQSNFHDCPMLRINEVPPIDVHLIKSGAAPGGIGEAGTTAAAPALRNAIFAATGVALRTMPLNARAIAEGRKSGSSR